MHQLANAQHELAFAEARLAASHPLADHCKAAEKAAALAAQAAEAQAVRMSLHAISDCATHAQATAARATARQTAAHAAAAARELCEARGTIHAAKADVATAKRTLQCMASDIAAPVQYEIRSPPSPPTVTTAPMLCHPSPPSPLPDLLRVEISLCQPMPPPPSTNRPRVVETHTAGSGDECDWQEPGKHGNGECGRSNDKEIAWLEECEHEHESECGSEGSMYEESGHDKQNELEAILWLDEREREHESDYDKNEIQLEREAIEWLNEREYEHELSDDHLSEQDDVGYDSFDEYYLLYE